MQFYGVTFFVVCPFPVIAIATPAPVESYAPVARSIDADSPCLAADVAPALTTSGLPTIVFPWRYLLC